MKYILQILFLLIIPIAVSAQNYACFTPGNKQYFINANGYLRGSRIDSVKNNGSTTVLYPFHSPRGYYRFEQKLDTNSGSWMGKTITIQADGTYEFEDYWGDTVFIQTLAGLNDEWTLFNDTTDIYYTAKISYIDTMTVLGVIDSVKEITITAHDATGILSTDVLNNATMLLSKEHGFARVCDLFMFPLHEPNKPIGQDFDYFLDQSIISYPTFPLIDNIMFRLVPFAIPTIEELFDFKHGDKFDYRIIEATTEKLIKDEIIGRINIGAPGQVTYRVSRWIQTTTRSGSAPPVTKTEAQWFDRTEGMYNWNHLAYMPEEWGQRMFYHYLPADTTHCQVSAKYSIGDNFIGYSVNTFEPCGWHATYKAGLGKLHESICYDPPGDIYTWDLIYSSKNGSDCGSLILEVNSVKANTDIILYPIPAQNSIDIELPLNEKYTITITDMMGKKHGQYAITGSTEIDINHLPNGFYNMAILGGDGDLINKKFSVAH